MASCVWLEGLNGDRSLILPLGHLASGVADTCSKTPRLIDFRGKPLQNLNVDCCPNSTILIVFECTVS